MCVGVGFQRDFNVSGQLPASAYFIKQFFYIFRPYQRRCSAAEENRGNGSVSRYFGIEFQIFAIFIDKFILFVLFLTLLKKSQ